MPPITPIQSGARRNKGKNGPIRGEQYVAEKFNLGAYFKGVRQEWYRITWPPKEQVIAQTGVVLLVVALFSITIFLMDFVLQQLIQLIT